MTAIRAKRYLNFSLDLILPRGTGRASRRVRRTRTSDESSPDTSIQPVLGPDRIYIVRVGDSLSKIAEETLGNAARWSEILEANKAHMKGEGLIWVGQKLYIPEV